MFESALRFCLVCTLCLMGMACNGGGGTVAAAAARVAVSELTQGALRLTPIQMESSTPATTAR